MHSSFSLWCLVTDTKYFGIFNATTSDKYKYSFAYIQENPIEKLRLYAQHLHI